jgi:hypothetical protein
MQQPLRVRLHVDHRHGATELELCNELEQERRRRLPAWEDFVSACFRIVTEIPMPSDAAEV